MKIIVTGGRDYNNANRLNRVLSTLKPTTIVEGGSSGADRLAKDYANSNNIKLLTNQADWDKHGPSAGPLRNKKMILEHPDAIVLAFPGGKGTANCINQAMEYGMVVLLVPQ